MFVVPAFFLWLGVWLWFASRRRRYLARPDVFVVTLMSEEQLAAISSDAAMVRTLHEIMELDTSGEG